MNRRGISLLLALLLTLSLTACGGGGAKQEETPEPPAQAQPQAPEEPTGEPAGEPVEEPEKPEQPAGETPQPGAVQTADVSPEQQGMLPVLDSILLYVQESQGGAYDGKDPACVWSVLYYLLANPEEERFLTGDGVREDGSQLFTRRGVEECAAAAFADFDGLPLDGLEGLHWGLDYDESWDAVARMPGDRGDTQSDLLSWQDNGDGTYTAKAALSISSEGTVLAEGTFLLRDNPNLDGITDPLFYYTVEKAQVERYPLLQEIYLEGDFRGLADSHSAEFCVEEETTVFQLSEDAAQQLAELEPGAIVGFYATMDESTGVSTIVRLADQ